MTELRSPSPATSGKADPAHPRIWVLDDPRPGTSAQALGIAERLGEPFRRIPLIWNWKTHFAGLVPGGSLMGLGRPGITATDLSHPPELVISAGRRSAAVALWMKAHTGCRIVHCMSPGVAGLLRRSEFDLLVLPEHDHAAPAPNVFTILGAPHRMSQAALAVARETWDERLAHLPHPRVALLIGGPPKSTNMAPALAHQIGQRIARLVAVTGGSIMATTSRRTGREATEALAAGLGPCLHVLYRWGEPGENPYRGFLANADVIVITADSVSMISEACATNAAVYVALPELASRRQQRLSKSLFDAGQARPFDKSIVPWQRPTLDEADRVATEIRRRFGLG